MTTVDIQNAESWLKILKNPNVERAQLAARLLQWRSNNQILEPYRHSELEPAIEHRKNRWDALYFSTQADAAKRNFSLERAEHLLEVRERLQQQRETGFLPAKPSQPASRSMLHDTSIERIASGFEPTQSLAKAASSGDTMIIRAALGLEMSDLRLPTSYLVGALGWVQANWTEVFAPYTEGRFRGPMDENKASWTSEYHDTQMVFLEANFSVERFLHVIQVREHLSAKGAPGFTSPAEMLKPSKSDDTAAHRSRRGKGTQHAQATSPNAWPARIALMIAAGLAALAAIFFGGRR